MKFSSPFRESRNSQSQSTQQQYEEEFWKLKAQRLEAKNEELSKENQALVKKSIESSKREQELIDKLASQSTLERSRSRRRDEKEKQSEGEAAREQIERLGKEIRVLKNQHSIEMVKTTEECKTLKKKISELESKQMSWVPGEQHANKVRALSEEITTLTKRQAISEQQVDRMREEKKKLLSDIQALTKEVSMMKAREKAAQKQEEENLMDLHKYERFIHQYKSEKSQIASDNTSKDELSSIPLATGEASQEIVRLRKEVQTLEKEKQSNRKLLMDISSWQHDKTRTEAKLKQMESELADSKAELKNVLNRLSPLLSQRAELKGMENVEAKASLTLLEVFLKKYKIQAF